MHRIIKKHRNAVGSGNTDADTPLGSNQSVHSLKHGCALQGRKVHHSLINHLHTGAMGLMGQYKARRFYMEIVAKKLPVCRNMQRVVSAIAVDIERCIVAFTDSSGSPGTEGNDFLSQIIMQKIRSHCCGVLIISAHPNPLLRIQSHRGPRYPHHR